MAYKKGKKFEKETAELAGKGRGRVSPKSGAIGTTYGAPNVAGDASWKFPWLPKDKTIQIECKHGYDKSKTVRKSMTIYRDWFDKHLGQAKMLGFIPMFAMKFKFTTSSSGLSSFILIPFSTMEKLLKIVDNMWEELEELRNEKKEWENGR